MFTRRGHTISDAKKIAALPDLREGDEHTGIDNVQNFLRRFGYLAPREGDVREAAARSRLDEVTAGAIRSYQRFHGLDLTGMLDQPTRQMMSAPRCGMPDLPELAFSTIGPWARRNLTYRFDNLTSQTVGAMAARAAIGRAFGTWQAAGVGLGFEEVAANGDIVIDFRAANDPDHSMVGGVLAHADFPPGFSTIVNALPLPLHFDDTEHTWVDGAVAGGFDIETIALHEIGHTLGLLHTGVPGSVMFPTVSANRTLRAIQADDLSSIRALYPPNGTLQSAASWGSGRFDVFGFADDGSVLQLWYENGWHRTNLGNGFSGDRFLGQMAAASWGSNRLDVFGLGQTGNVLQLWWNGNWHWSNLGNGFSGTRFFGPISAASWGNGRYDVFGFDENGDILQLWWDGRWHWSNLGNGWGVSDLMVGQVAAASWGNNRLDVFALQRNGNVLQLWWDGSWHWSNLGNGFSGTRFAGPLTAASWGPNRLDVFGLSPTGDILQLWFANGEWHWSNLGSGFSGDRFAGLITAASWGPNRLDVYGLGQGGNVLQLWWNGSWHWSNLGSLT